MMQFICLKQLRGVMIETPMVIAVVYLCIQMIKGSYFSSVPGCPCVAQYNYKASERRQRFLMKQV